MAQGLERGIVMIAKNLEQITSEQITDRIILRQADALVKITSHWNAASQMLSHTLQTLASQYSGKVAFFSLNYETEATLSDVYFVDSVPTILFFKKGTLVDKLSGLAHRTIIANKINQLINS
ncbi:MAG TPA: thioredoxin domain-containing protein [Chryseolinea sp.]